MNIDIPGMYHEYIQWESDNRSEAYKEWDGWFRASSAGQCFKKQAYRLRKVEGETMEPRVSRNLRLGTIIHEDIAKAVQIIETEGQSYFTEYRVEIPDFKVVGHIDVATMDGEGPEKPPKNGQIVDIKTVHSYKWRKMFGYKKNRDTNPSKNYETQVGTYAIGLADKHNLDHVDMSILWYKKDDGNMKYQTVHQKYIAVAMEYWAELTEIIDSIKGQDIGVLAAGTEPNVPIYEWECRYCEFRNICDTPFNRSIT